MEDILQWNETIKDATMYGNYIDNTQEVLLECTHYHVYAGS